MNPTPRHPPVSGSLTRITGLLTILIGLLAVAAIFTNLDLVPEYDHAAEDTLYLADNLPRLAVNSWTWLANSMMIIIFSPMVYLLFRQGSRLLSLIMACLVFMTGMLYLLYGLRGFELMELAGSFSMLNPDGGGNLETLAVYTLSVRQHLQLAAFTMAGTGAVFFGCYILVHRSLPSFTAILALIGGTLYAVFGWTGRDNLLFSAGRLMFIMNLLVAGSYLLFRGLRTGIRSGDSS